MWARGQLPPAEPFFLLLAQLFTACLTHVEHALLCDPVDVRKIQSAGTCASQTSNFPTQLVKLGGLSAWGYA
jgi:hypothetical protein